MYLGLKAVNCRTGDSLVQEQLQAARKEDVLKVLGEASTKLREKLGESLSTVEKFDTPLEQATTPSIESLQAYSLGLSWNRKGDSVAAVPLYERAIRLDPNFAMAYAELGISYSNLGEDNLAAQTIRKAYELREQTSEREKLAIDSLYPWFVTGDLEKAQHAYEVWAQTYTRDATPQNNLASIHLSLGHYDQALAKARETVRLDPGGSPGYNNLVGSYFFLNRLEEARATAEEAQSKKLDSTGLRLYLYLLAFLRNDAAGMARFSCVHSAFRRYSLAEAGLENRSTDGSSIAQRRSYAGN